MQKIMEKAYKSITITDEEVKEFYEKETQSMVDFNEVKEKIRTNLSKKKMKKIVSAIKEELTANDNVSLSDLELKEKLAEKMLQKDGSIFEILQTKEMKKEIFKYKKSLKFAYWVDKEKSKSANENLDKIKNELLKTADVEIF